MFLLFPVFSGFILVFGGVTVNLKQITETEIKIDYNISHVISELMNFLSHSAFSKTKGVLCKKKLQTKKNVPPTWRIIPVSKWLVTPMYKPWKGHLEGEQPQLGDLQTMVINHLPTGMILQVNRGPQAPLVFERFPRAFLDVEDFFHLPMIPR